MLCRNSSFFHSLGLLRKKELLIKEEEYKVLCSFWDQIEKLEHKYRTNRLNAYYLLQKKDNSKIFSMRGKLVFCYFANLSIIASI